MFLNKFSVEFDRIFKVLLPPWCHKKDYGNINIKVYFLRKGKLTTHTILFTEVKVGWRIYCGI